MNLRNGFNYGKKVVTTGACDMLILDEVLGIVDEKVISLKKSVSCLPQSRKK